MQEIEFRWKKKYIDAQNDSKINLFNSPSIRIIAHFPSNYTTSVQNNFFVAPMANELLKLLKYSAKRMRTNGFEQSDRKRWKKKKTTVILPRTVRRVHT